MNDLKPAINSLQHALVALTELAEGQMPVQEQIFTAVSFYTLLCYERAASDEIASKTIQAAVEFGASLKEEPTND
jgi:hypothetical protein